MEIDGRPVETLNHKLEKDEARDCNLEEHTLYRTIVMNMDY